MFYVKFQNGTSNSYTYEKENQFSNENEIADESIRKLWTNLSLKRMLKTIPQSGRVRISRLQNIN